MPDNALTMEELEEIRDEAMADDLEIDFEKMTLWTRDEAVAFFESGEEPRHRGGPTHTLCESSTRTISAISRSRCASCRSSPLPAWSS